MHSTVVKPFRVVAEVKWISPSAARFQTLKKNCILDSPSHPIIACVFQDSAKRFFDLDIKENIIILITTVLIKRITLPLRLYALEKKKC